MHGFTFEAAQSIQPLAQGSTLMSTNPSTNPGSFSWTGEQNDITCNAMNKYHMISVNFPQYSGFKKKQEKHWKVCTVYYIENIIATGKVWESLWSTSHGLGLTRYSWLQHPNQILSQSVSRATIYWKRSHLVLTQKFSYVLHRFHTFTFSPVLQKS